MAGKVGDDVVGESLVLGSLEVGFSTTALSTVYFNGALKNPKRKPNFVAIGLGTPKPNFCGLIRFRTPRPKVTVQQAFGAQ